MCESRTSGCADFRAASTATRNDCAPDRSVEGLGSSGRQCGVVWQRQCALSLPLPHDPALAEAVRMYRVQFDARAMRCANSQCCARTRNAVREHATRVVRGALSRRTRLVLSIRVHCVLLPCADKLLSHSSFSFALSRPSSITTTPLPPPPTITSHHHPPPLVLLPRAQTRNPASPRSAPSNPSLPALACTTDAPGISGTPSDVSTPSDPHPPPTHPPGAHLRAQQRDSG